MTIVRNGERPDYVPPGHDEMVTAMPLFDPRNGSHLIDVHVTTFAPGTSMDEEVHPHSDHVLYLLSGTIEVQVRGRPAAIVHAQDAVHIPAGEYHRVSNTSGMSASFVAVTAPPLDQGGSK